MEINISNTFFIVDDEDYDRIRHLTFSLSDGRVMTYDKETNTASHLGRILLNITDPKILVDHKDRNPLNNRKLNLRPCLHIDNMQNQKKPKNNTSGYKGVDKQGNRWRASISVNYCRISLGGFSTAKEAAKAYNRAALKYHGEFASLNLIED